VHRPDRMQRLAARYAARLGLDAARACICAGPCRTLGQLAY
jgi:hypothetical protein